MTWLGPRMVALVKDGGPLTLENLIGFYGRDRAKRSNQ